MYPFVWTEMVPLMVITVLIEKKKYIKSKMTREKKQSELEWEQRKDDKKMEMKKRIQEKQQQQQQKKKRVGQYEGKD